MKFPVSEKGFRTWWKGQKDVPKNPRSGTCPIARCLRASGQQNVVVRADEWYTRANVAGAPLPRWAWRAVCRFDRALSQARLAKL